MNCNCPQPTSSCYYSCDQPDLLPCEQDENEEEDTCAYLEEEEPESLEPDYLPCEEPPEGEVEEDTCAYLEEEVDEWVPPPLLACEEREPTNLPGAPAPAPPKA